MRKKIIIDENYVANVPTSWEDITFEEFHRLEIWKKTKDQNLVMALSIMTDIPFKIWNNCNVSDWDIIIAPILKFLFTPPQIRTKRMERTINIMDKEIEIPLDASLETLGQKVACDQEMSKYAVAYKKDITRLGYFQMSYLIAAYLSPKISGKDFDMEFTELVQIEVQKSSALKMLPIGAFFLKKYVASLNLNKAFPQRKGILPKLGHYLKRLIHLDFSGHGTHLPVET